MRIAATQAALDAIRGSWEALQGDVPSTDPDVFAALSAAESGAIRPHVVVLERDGAPVAAAVAKVRDMPLPTRLGRLELYAPSVRALVVVDGGLLGRIDGETSGPLLGALLAVLGSGEADVCVIRHVPLASPLHRAARERVPRARRGLERFVSARWSRPLPDSYGELLATLSPKTRKSTRSSLARLERELGSRVELRSFRSPSELALFFADAEQVARRTYQQGLGVGLRDEGSARLLVGLAAERGWFRGWVLSVDGQPVAFDLGVLYRKTFHWLSGGFDPEYARYRPGACLTALIVRELCDDPAVSALDFGLGDADYKRRLGCSRQLERDIVLVAPRGRPLRINALRNGLTVLTEPLRLLRRTDVAGRLVRRVERRSRPRTGIR